VQAALQPGAVPLKSLKQSKPKKEKAPAPAAAKPAKPVDKSPLRIVAADFVAGAGPSGSLPAPVRAEIAFAGRSNVGKSSLINALVERKSLVRTSSTPGSTRQVNLYEARAADGAVFHLVDLPGYGFNRRSKAEQRSWAELIEAYLGTRSTLATVVILVDVRRGLEDDDRELITFIDAAKPPSRRPVEVLVVATKLDKLSLNERKVALARLGREAGRKVLGFSSVTGEGREALWRALRRATLGEAALAAQGDAAPGEDPHTDARPATTANEASPRAPEGSDQNG
jgi:GTP-binding protein